MEDWKRAQARLDNIRSVQPILSALRTISLGSWRMALRKRDDAHRYATRLEDMLPALWPHIRLTSHRELLPDQEPRQKMPPSPERIVVLVIGSERGLCGTFNTAVVGCAERHLAELPAGAQVELMVLGTRVSRIFHRRRQPLRWSGTLSMMALPDYRLALSLTRQWLARYQAHDLDAVDLVYNAYRGTVRYIPTVVRLIPPALPATEQAGNSSSELWPPPIIETDPVSLYTRLIEQWISASLYSLLLDSAAAEHSARFQLLEGATQNAKRLVTELMLVVQTARKQAITREMQDLAAGAGLIGTRPE
ncbi:MAG: F0F1 ATP synthase subunit gamma [Anaerolineae bacterium]|nr:F0F1 ATP synthase subunit gamma [Anaerolineae bacterium]